VFPVARPTLFFRADPKFFIDVQKKMAPVPTVPKTGFSIASRQRCEAQTIRVPITYKRAPANMAAQQAAEVSLPAIFFKKLRS
jgi:hypothetical protein